MAPPARRLIRECPRVRGHLAVAAALGAATAACVILQAVLLARIVARVFLGGAGLGDVRGELLALGLAFAGRAVLASGFEVSGHLGAARAMSALRGRLADHALGARPAGLDGERSGELAAVAVQGVDGLDAYFSRFLPQVVLAVVVPVAVLAWVAPADPESAVIMLLTLPLIPAFMILIGLAARRSATARWRVLSNLSAHFLDVVRGLETLRANNRAEAQVATIREVGERFRRETMRTLRVAFLSALVLELAATLAVALLAVTIGVRLVEGSLAFETGLMVLILAPELYLPLRQVGAQYHASVDGLAAAERMFAVLDTSPGLAPATAALRPAPRAPGAVRLEGVGFAYPARPGAVLQNVDLELRAGERLALVGPSGSGKSTVAALLLRLADPERGRVSVDGVDLRDLDPVDWRRRIAWVPQRPRLFAGTVADNVRLGDPAASDDRVWAALDDAGAAGFVSGLPEGLATRVGDGGRTLSAGEIQRLAVARALLRDAPIVVLDEPTSNLDAESAALVERAVETLAAGRMTLVITHDAGVAARADRACALVAGRVAVPPAAAPEMGPAVAPLAAPA